MIKGWQKRFETEGQKEEFAQFFREFAAFEESEFPTNKGQQPNINLFLMSQVILLRNEVKQLKREKENERRNA